MIRSRAGLKTRIFAAVGVAALVGGAVATGQGTPIPVKLGLWETTVSSSNQMSLPPEAEARIAALPPDQQAMVRSRMGGAPVAQTHKSCVASQTTMDALLNREQNHPDAKCTFSNRTQTSTGASFDTVCTMPQGTMKGHSEFHMVDSDHLTGTTHMSGTMSGRNGQSTTMNMTSTMTSKYLGADCGDVKPSGPGAAE
jgi:Protein of unknown function (DUF3617)